MADESDLSDVRPTAAERKHLRERRREADTKRKTAKRKRQAELALGRPDGPWQRRAVMMENAYYLPARSLARNVVSADGTASNRTCELVGDVFVAGAGVTSWSKRAVTKKRRDPSTKDRGGGDAKSDPPKRDKATKDRPPAKDRNPTKDPKDHQPKSDRDDADRKRKPR